MVRTSINLPCITIILVYHVDKTKRNKYLNNMLKPLQQNIMNGEVLKQYNNLKLDQNEADASKFPVVFPMPHIEKTKKDVVVNSSIQSSLTASQLTADTNNNNNNINDAAVANYANQNRYYYKFNNPENKFVIQVRPSQNNTLAHYFVNIDDIKLNGKPPGHQINLDQIDKSLYSLDQPHSFRSDAMTSSLISELGFKKQFTNDPNALHLVWGVRGGAASSGGVMMPNASLNQINRPISVQNGHTELKHISSDQIPMYQPNNLIQNFNEQDDDADDDDDSPSEQPPKRQYNKSNFIYERYANTQSQNPIDSSEFKK